MRVLFNVLAPSHHLATKHKVRVEFLVAQVPLALAAYRTVSDRFTPLVISVVSLFLVVAAIFRKDQLTSSFFLFDCPKVSNNALRLYVALVVVMELLPGCLSSDPCRTILMFPGALNGLAWCACPVLDNCRGTFLLIAASTITGLLKLCLSMPNNLDYSIARAAAVELLFRSSIGVAIRWRLRVHGQQDQTAHTTLTAASLAQMTRAPRCGAMSSASRHRRTTNVLGMLPLGSMTRLSSEMHQSFVDYARSRRLAKNDLVACRILFAHLDRPANSHRMLPAAVADSIRRCFPRRPAESFAQCVSTHAGGLTWSNEDGISDVDSEASSGSSSLTTRSSMTSIQLTWRRLKRDITWTELGAWAS
mmetsp:Transcript_117963/g.328714  ORF Transcript_117963/g.328714 Transcript_117963/m.328714 type:complete len:362 (-) Transcript_117963:52-1137(-)